MKKRQPVITLLLLGQLLACSNENADPLCDNHAAMHQQHMDSVTVVNIVYTDNGDLAASINIPHTDATETALSDISKIFDVTAKASCKVLPAKVSSNNNRWQAEYDIECSANNKLELVSISILKHFPQINEIEAHIKTPATDKNFIINRQCERPIFSL